MRALPWGDEEALRRLLREHRPDVVLASDLVYFPFLYPPLLRTLIGLTTPTQGGGGPKVLFSYKVRSLVREEPFWSAFGASCSRYAQVEADDLVPQDVGSTFKPS